MDFPLRLLKHQHLDKLLLSHDVLLLLSVWNPRTSNTTFAHVLKSVVKLSVRVIVIDFIRLSSMLHITNRLSLSEILLLLHVDQIILNIVNRWLKRLFIIIVAYFFWAESFLWMYSTMIITCITSDSIKVNQRAFNIIRRYFIVLITSVSSAFLSILNQMWIKLVLWLTFAIRYFLTEPLYKLTLCYLLLWNADE